MKKRLLGLILALTCLLLPVLTSCGSGKDYVATAKVKPMTITLYGITGETTTEEAILEVQNELNEYTEGNLSTRVLLRLFTEDEYYAKLDEAIAKAQAYKEEQKNKDEEETTEDETKKEDDKENDNSGRFEVTFEDEKGTQVDIFMVRGSDKLQEYVAQNIVSPIKIEEKNSIISKYVSSKYIALASDGAPTSGGNVDSKATVYGVPCNYVTGDYAYLLVNKEIADNYGYAAQDVDTLDELSNFLDDAAKDYSNYVTLYNAPELKVQTFGNTFIGAAIPNGTHAFSYVQPGSLFKDAAYVNFQKNLGIYKRNGYITEGDYYSLPEDKKVAAAFIKGNAALPAEYEDEYIVVPYSNPYVDDLGTVFCVSKLTTDVSRCLEVISQLMTNPEYRNTFQYGVENKHYKVNDYTKELEIINDDYCMNYADTGNMFILQPNTSMSPEMLALAANNWALAKQQYRDAYVNPFTVPYMKFTMTYYDETNYVTSSWYAEAFMDNMVGVVDEFDDYKTGLEKAMADAQAEVDAENEKNKDNPDWIAVTVNKAKVIKDFNEDFVEEYLQNDGKWYGAVLEGSVESDFIDILEDKKAIAESYLAAKASAESKNETFDETKWYISVISGKTNYNSIESISNDMKAYKAALKAAKTEAEKNKVDFDQSKFNSEYVVEFDVADIVSEGKAFSEALAQAKSEAAANDAEFDEDAFVAEYIKSDVEDIKAKHTFPYEPGYTADNMAAIELLTEKYLQLLMDFDPEAGRTFEHYALILDAQYVREDYVQSMVDITLGDSIPAQYLAWADGMGIVPEVEE